MRFQIFFELNNGFGVSDDEYKGTLYNDAKVQRARKTFSRLNIHDNEDFMKIFRKMYAADLQL